MDKNKIGKIPVFPNAFPYNELLLSGKLLAKTRDWKWNYRGPVLLYTSGRSESSVWRGYKLMPKDYPHKAIVGRGNLVDCRPLSDEERKIILRQFNPAAKNELNWWEYVIYPMYNGFFFEDLVRFPEPIAFNWPAGAILPVWMPIESVQGLLTSPVDPTIKSLTYVKPEVKPKREERWAELIDEKVASLKHMSHYKIRMPSGWEVMTTWDKEEGCFFWSYGEDAVYWDEPDGWRPTHIRVGFA